MARTIDFENLKEDDYQYLSDRHWMIAEGDAQGFETSDKIAAWRAGNAPAAVEEIDEEEIDLEKITVKELQAELKARDLPTDGKKEELIARLIEHDSADEDEEDDAEDAEIPEED